MEKLWQKFTYGFESQAINFFEDNTVFVERSNTVQDIH